MRPHALLVALFLGPTSTLGVAWAEGASTPEVDIGSKGQAAPAHDTLKVGMVAVLGSKEAKANSDKLAKYLSKTLGKKVEPQVFTDYDSVANAIVDQSIDAAWLPPAQAYNAKLGGATLPVKLIRNGADHYRSVLFTRADGKFQSITAVQGAKVAWVDRNSSTGYLFPLALMAKLHLDPNQLFSEQKFLGNHEAVCKAVYAGQVDIGATLANEPPEGTPLRELEVTGCKNALGPKSSKLKVVAVSAPVPNDALALRKDLDAASRDAITKVVLNLPENPDGQALLRDVFKADGMAASQEGDFDPVQAAIEAAATVDTAQKK